VPVTHHQSGIEGPAGDTHVGIGEKEYVVCDLPESGK
jgi:hypothetical protein